MNITNEKLKLYINKIDQILSTLTDANVSMSVRKSRITDVKSNIEKIIDYLIKAKEKSYDVVFKSEIDYIVDKTSKDYSKILNELMSPSEDVFTQEKYSYDIFGCSSVDSVDESVSNLTKSLNNMLKKEPKSDNCEELDNNNLFNKNNNNNTEGFYAINKEDCNIVFLKDTKELKEYLLNFIGKKMPVIIKGAIITPKVNITIDM